MINKNLEETDIKFILELDDSTYYGVYDYFFSAFSNIVDNMLRYAKTTIRITLKQHILTFENDGEKNRRKHDTNTI